MCSWQIVFAAEVLRPGGRASRLANEVSNAVYIGRICDRPWAYRVGDWVRGGRARGRREMICWFRCCVDLAGCGVDLLSE